MKNLNQALSDIAALRGQMARATEFRGYGPATLAATGAFGLLAAMAQDRVFDRASGDFSGYLSLWIGTAVLSFSVVAIEVWRRSRRIHSGLATEMILLAIERFLPAAAAGVLLTLVIARRAPESFWLLPGLWQIVLGLGVFASGTSLPRPLLAVGAWYLATGLGCVAFAQGADALSPWAMGAPFAIGQSLAAMLLQLSGAADEQA